MGQTTEGSRSSDRAERVLVLIDATIVRGVLLPATMKLLGNWNWYLPRWLRWLPKLKLEDSPGTPAPELR